MVDISELDSRSVRRTGLHALHLHSVFLRILTYYRHSPLGFCHLPGWFDICFGYGDGDGLFGFDWVGVAACPDGIGAARLVFALLFVLAVLIFLLAWPRFWVLGSLISLVGWFLLSPLAHRRYHVLRVYYCKASEVSWARYTA